jgi:hypothetical protein
MWSTLPATRKEGAYLSPEMGFVLVAGRVVPVLAPVEEVDSDDEKDRQD